jgi:hypothetical protein
MDDCKIPQKHIFLTFFEGLSHGSGAVKMEQNPITIGLVRWSVLGADWFSWGWYTFIFHFWDHF